ncbi:hypothetical protein GY45DRAFT_1259900, partial [Cubamyces sp. BRFM 1775]
ITAQVCPLNDDVILRIFDTVQDPDDVSAMMRTCWSMYHLGVKRLVSMGAHITTDSTLIFFCHFMRRNRSVAHRLTELWLDIPRDSVVDDDSSSEDSFRDESCEEPILRGAALLVHILPLLTGIRAIQFNFCEGFLQCDHRLVDAFAALPAVYDLRLGSFGLLTYELISSMRSNIALLFMECSVADRTLSPLDHRVLFDPLDLLNTLEELRICFIDLTANTVRPGPSTSVYPHVRLLSLAVGRFEELEILVNAFPNLRILDVTLCFHLDVEVRSLRARNRTVRCWDALEHVCGDICNLYILGLTCPVARVDIALDNPGMVREHLHEVLSDMQWSSSTKRIFFRLGFYLLIAGGKLRDDCAVTASDISHLLPPHATTSGVTHLGLDLNADFVVGDPIYYQRAAVSLLSRSRIRFFKFRIHVCTVESEGKYDHDAPLGPYRGQVLRKFQRPFLTFWAAKIAEAAPTVQFVCFEVMRRRTYWQVVREPGPRDYSLIQLSEEASRELVENEQMEWHRTAHTIDPSSEDTVEEESEDDSDSGNLSDAMSVTSDSSPGEWRGAYDGDAYL